MKYDLVVCSNTLLELPSTSERLETLSKLWDRVEKVRFKNLLNNGLNIRIREAIWFCQRLARTQGSMLLQRQGII